jgi:hypothetical protein
MTLVKDVDNEKDLADFWEFEFINQLHKEYKHSQSKYTDKELLTVFPEVVNDLPLVLRRLYTAKQLIIDKLKVKLLQLKQTNKNEFEYWLRKEMLKATVGQELIEAKRRIRRLKALISISAGKTPKGRLTEEQIMQARQVPIEELYEGQLRQRGKTLVGLCPFHQEKHGSFTIYPDQNSWHCFGCGLGGSVIDFTMKIRGLNFRQTIKYLIGE